ncbi:hypothetical protein [Thalassotalea aquiviva]|uniref:hypothetical protein n=1 Tax=Thalassotalea aquiviva TaxID=3242415 RepID=UPI00352A327B
MSSIPSFESILLQVHQSLELPPYTSKQKSAFAKLKRPLKKHHEQFEEIMDGIFRALEINKDRDACIDLMGNMENFAQFQKELEHKIWTFNANSKQVVWQLVSHSYIPGIARFVANWSFEDIIDEGMPGGYFWYLPTETEDRSRVMMPVEQVCTWLLDLLGLRLEQLRNLNVENTNTESVIRNIYNWKKGKVPRLETIKQTFSDDNQLEFKGCLRVDKNLDEKKQLQQVLAFIKHKNLTVDLLAHEIPITDTGIIEKIIEGKGSSDQNQSFIKLMAIRYAQPTFKIIRQRLYLAKAIQDGYKRLLKFLCPEVDPICADVNKNKVLQLCHMYKYVYNLTIEASRLNHGQYAENKWFDEHLLEIDKNGLFLSIAPSRFAHSSSLLGDLLTKRFERMNCEQPLPDLFDSNPEANLDVFKQKMIEQKLWADETKAEKELEKLLRKGAPWRAFQKENNYWVISKFANDNSYGYRIKEAAIKRLYEVAKTSLQEAGAILLESGYILDLPKNKRPIDSQKVISNLLDNIEQHAGFDAWEAPLLCAKAKHFIALNDFKAALNLFKQALHACEERGFGPLRGAIARDTFATLLQTEKLNSNNHEMYLREMMAFGAFETTSAFVEIRLESVAADLHTYFWGELYKPYHGVKKLYPSTKQS